MSPSSLMPSIPSYFKPVENEIGVLSVLSAESGGSWHVLAGSLLAMPEELERMSWLQWANHQPNGGSTSFLRPEPDLGTHFNEEPFPGVRIFRRLVLNHEWDQIISDLESGHVETPLGPTLIDLEPWSSTQLLAEGDSDAHRVVNGANRPIRGVAATTRTSLEAVTYGHWVKGGLPKDGGKHTRAEMHGKESFFNWPIKQLGIYWTGDAEIPAPRSFVVGKAVDEAWITRVKPDHEHDQIVISLAWHAHEIDPIGCSVLVRTEENGAPISARLWKVSDLPHYPSDEHRSSEPRKLDWSRRTLDVRLPRGARRSAWGVALFGPDGLLLDERPVARRVERIDLAFRINDSAPESTTVGDDREPPSNADRDEAVKAALNLETETRKIAAERRLASTDQLRDYLKWRFSTVAGELLVMDRYLLHDEKALTDRVLAFLASLNRPIRALVTKRPEEDGEGEKLLASFPLIEVRKVSESKFHDRFWIAGDTGLTMGASVNKFLRDPAKPTIAATTVVDLPHADVIAWKELFEEWWPNATSILED